jgi:hypothetical protein
MGSEGKPWPIGNGPNRLPLTLKIAFTVYIAVLVPTYLHFWGPLNFLWFCDVSMFLTLIALWTESSLLASMPAVAIVLPQLMWAFDFVYRAIAGPGNHFPTDLTEYMFKPEQSLFVRGLSTFHGWLPFLLLWLVWRLGYDRRAWWAMTLFGWGVVLLSYFLVTTNDPSGAGNVNKIFGPNDEEPITSMSRLQWLGVLMLIYPAIYIVSHLLLRLVFAPPRDVRPA